jgi:hypothetical protein
VAVITLAAITLAVVMVAPITERPNQSVSQKSLPKTTLRDSCFGIKQQGARVLAKAV